MSGWIKLHRKLLGWEWYTDANALRLFVHCLLKASYKDTEFRGVAMKAGSFATSLKHLSSELGMSVKATRLTIDKLVVSKNILYKGTRKGTFITVCNYDSYNSKEDDESPKGAQKGSRKGAPFKEERNKEVTSKEVTVSKQYKTETIQNEIPGGIFDFPFNDHLSPAGRLEKTPREDVLGHLHESFEDEEGEPTDLLIAQHKVISSTMVKPTEQGVSTMHSRILDHYTLALSVSFGSTKYRAEDDKVFKSRMSAWIIQRYTGTYWDLNLYQDTLAFYTKCSSGVTISAEKSERAKLSKAAKTIRLSGVKLQPFVHFLSCQVTDKQTVTGMLYTAHNLSAVLQQYTNANKLVR